MKKPRTLDTAGRLAATLCLLSLATPVVAPATDEPSAREILERHVEAIGGSAAVLEKSSRRLRGTFEVQGFSGPFEVARADGKFVFTLELPGTAPIRQGFDGKTAWEIAQTGPNVLEGTRLEDAVLQADPANDLRLAEKYRSIERDGTEDLDGKKMNRLELVTTSGRITHELYDPDTGLRRAVIAEAQTPQGPQEVILVYDDYREFEGLQVPTTIFQRVAGQESVRRVESVSFDELPADTFALPEEIQALLADKTR